MGILLNIKNMYKIYNSGDSEVRALDGVSLRVEHGEFIVILGQSGSGKSTFINMLGCLDTPTMGNYELEGEDVSALSDDALSEIRNKRIGFIFQGFNLIESMTAFENVELPLLYRGIPKPARVRMTLDALERVGLPDRINHRPAQLSGGQQQRVAIARALAARPPLILADEPTGNLDSHTSSEVMQALTELNNDGHTIILITHDSGMQAYASRVIKVCDGKIIQDRHLRLFARRKG